jgi:hypothetical protein
MLGKHEEKHKDHGLLFGTIQNDLLTEKHKDHDLHGGTIQKETHIETIEKEKLV